MGCSLVCASSFPAISLAIGNHRGGLSAKQRVFYLDAEERP
jgi:hypothetical protein